MGRSYREISAERWARVSPEVQNDRSVFEQAYDAAMQLLTQSKNGG